jgi:cardiolipin synthase C
MSLIADHGAQNSASVRLIPFISTLFLVAGLIAGCGTLPSLDQRSISTALSDTGNTRLGRAVSPRGDLHPGKSGLYPLLNARDAFAARAHLAAAAERSLDVQYYIWHKDRTGTLLFEALRRAADRGVRVRLLLDDNNTSGLDATLAALDSHPNIEVRLFNPFAIRQPRWIAYLTDFSRVNRRMHNKSFTADNQVAIIGGRNVGDEYFGASDGVLFADLDLMAVGPVVNEVSKDIKGF